MTFNYETRIPRERIAILIGTRGSVKRNIQEALSITLHVNSKEGDVTLEGEDSLDLFIGQTIVNAIGRGFNPEVALKLLGQENHFETINIEDYSGSSKEKLIRIRSRAIGTEGKARKTIEELTGTHTVIYGKTISIIGTYENVALARRAFESLLSGSRHSTIYTWLEKQRKKLRMKL